MASMAPAGTRTAGGLPGLDAATMCEAFQLTAQSRPDEVALRAPGGRQELTWRQYAERVRKVAGGLAALGVERGDTVALMLVNRPEFNVVDMAAAHLGATPFSVYNTFALEEIRELLVNSGCRVVVTERQFADRVLAAREGSAVESVVLVDGPGDNARMTLEELELLAEPGFDFEAAWRAVKPEDVLTLIYTSGTTGPPKGVELTHRNLMFVIRALCEIFDMPPGGRGTSYLPAAHIADRWAFHYWPCVTGAAITCVADAKQIAAVLPEVRPTYWGAVPRIWEKLMSALKAQGISDPAALSDEQRAGVLAKLGLDQCRFAVTGAAPTPPEVFEFFGALGLPICEVWGMSETAGLATINPPDRVRLGTVGLPLPGVQLRLADDGELLVRGPMVMRGYRREPDKTAETFDDDGWLLTGDIAQIDEDGYVRIVDRKKELIINAAGKNMSPANIEAKLKSSSPLVDQVVAIGDRRPYNVALITLDPDAAAAFAEQHGDESLDRLRDEVARAVERANEQLARVEQIKRFKLLTEQWTPAGDELTPTMKLKRRVIHEKYAEIIDQLYAG
jgi:long-subunit acyl-CoA synthetase (AMP-forming)